MLLPFPEERHKAKAAQLWMHRLPCGKGTFTQRCHRVLPGVHRVRIGRAAVTLHPLEAKGTLICARLSSSNVKPLIVSLTSLLLNQINPSLLASDHASNS